MKKRPVLWIVLAVVVVLIVAGVIWGRQYYEDHYVISDYYYAVVPEGYDMTPEPQYDNHGNLRQYGKEYTLTAYNDQGEARELEFTVMGDSSAQYPQPGTYLKISTSKQLVVGQSTVDKGDVPEKALEKLNAQ